MADEGTGQRESEDLMIQRHRKEKKDLQAEIQKLKHGFTKGDKKKKKEATDKIASLEAEMKTRHEKELADLQNAEADTDAGASGSAGNVDQVTAGLDDLTTQDDGFITDQPVKQKKASKAQKRREKKAVADQVREERIREQEIENLTSSRHLEAVKIGALLAQRGLQIFEIPSDGNCLYAAVSHQMSQRNITDDVGNLREKVASYMRVHSGDFMPFLTKDNGDCYTDDDFEKYCTELESTAAWGGQLEIQALSSVLELPIEVIQSEGPPIVTGEQFKQAPPLTLTYYRHAYGLGEHYHSVMEKQPDDDEFT